ncbi:alpha-amylase family protein [Corynebacterium sp. HMSC055D05]|uniref:alpha-amylase family protein n=1 Tax=Corynebacterium sp. HMSC055D05 TaxID=1715213 RepID=UPI0008A474B4|nr:alpha-amylase family protein [Corynebacterium sp. HMSC055D05]OFL93641.1 alpha-amylase [Corynebacterium sp. HMSC055D05]
MLDRTIWWHVYPLAALGAPIRDTKDAAHRLRGLEAWLDYLVELGCNGLLLGPIFESVTHGYDTLDHLRIDARLGDDTDIDWLINACATRGINIMLDGVFNHVARTHPWVEQGLAGDTDWEGHNELAALHHDEREIRDAVVDIMCHWLRRGIAGWRLDVAYAVPSEFWRDVLSRVREEFPDAMFLGEVIHGDYAEIAAAGTLDAVTQYELWKATWSSLADANFWELAHALERHPADLLTNTFIGNHDVDRIASTVGPDKLILAAAILMTVPGMPSIYYGDEQGFTGTRGEGWSADDAVRPALPTTPAELSPLGGWIYAEYQKLIGVRRRNAWLTRARVEVLDKTNETISFTCTDGEHTLQTDLWLAPTPGVRIHADGEELYSWMLK